MKKGDLKKITKKSLKEYWEANHEVLKYNFGLRLHQYAYEKYFDCTSEILPLNEDDRLAIINTYRGINRTSSRAKRFHRILLGYYGIAGSITPKRCNMSSKEANSPKNKDNRVNDHVIGVTTCSEYIKKIFLNGKRSNENTWKDEDWIKARINELCNNWLENNLWLWAECRITKKEHTVERLQRGTELKIKAKRKLEHYDNAEIIISDYQLSSQSNK